MIFLKTKFEADVNGFYILPFLAVGRKKGEAWSFWIGWLWFLFTIQKD